jgi:hypothetical protein
VVRGDPDEAELAAVVSVLTHVAAGKDQPDPAADATPWTELRATGTQWGAPRTLLRAPVATTGWWEQGLPR